MLLASPVDMNQVTGFLDELSPAARVHATLSLRAREQRALWHAAQGVYEITPEHLVPFGLPADTTVRHFGRNTMPAFSRFEKRFYRNAHGDMFGANFQTMAPLTGPGYFRVRALAEQRELLLDGARDALPSEAPAGWPQVVPNERGFSRFVYGFLVDHLRRVSEHVTIGEPVRHGKPLGSWFILCRES